MFSGNLLSSLTGKQNTILNEAQTNKEYYDNVDRIIFNLNTYVDSVYSDISGQVNSLI